MSITSPAQLLLAIAEHEPLEKTCAALGITRERAQALLQGAARALRDAAPQAQATHAQAPQAQATSAGRAHAAAASRATAAAGHAAARPAKATATSPEELERAADAILAKASRGQPASESSDAPLPQRVLVYSDGASRGNPGPGGAGAVIAEPGGRLLRKLGRFLGQVTNNVAEYEGLLLGLRGALAGGAREVGVRADSELMIRQLQGRYQVKNAALKPLFLEAKRLLREFERVTLEHVPRAQNADADEMSNRAIDEKM